MHSRNQWGGSFEIQLDSAISESEQGSNNLELDKAALLPESPPLEELRQRWIPAPANKNKSNYIDLGCIMCKKKLFRSVIFSVLIGLLVIIVPIIVVKHLPKHVDAVRQPDRYGVALRTALRFFNAQKSGRLPKNNGVPWRGDSGLRDGSMSSDLKKGLTGGYYDSGNNIKFHFPMAFSMTLLSWSVIEYGRKYEALGEYEHIKDIIKWGSDYLLQTFDSSASKIDKIYCQVGVSQRGSNNPDDGYCWQRPEDMSYTRPVLSSTNVPDLGSEIASALAAASIVFRDDRSYSDKLIKAAKTVYTFATQPWQQTPYSLGKPDIAQFYNSTGYWDEILWGAAWMFYATGNYSYLSLATDSSTAYNAKTSVPEPYLSVFSWDNKLPAAVLLLARFRMFLNPGYPYEEMLSDYHNMTGLNMCSYLRQFHIFDWTKGGLIQLNHGQPRSLQYAANAAFLTTLYADYLNASRVPGWYCGPYYFDSSTLHRFAATQINYILGGNPRKMSYLVGYGDNYPRHVHHRGASIPKNGKKYSCTDGWMWRDKKAANPNVIAGAMVAGPDKHDRFSDVRTKADYTEPTLAGNAGLVAALVSLADSSDRRGIDKNTIFSFLQPLIPDVPPPPPTWKP